jgi:hypothetical protein
VGGAFGCQAHMIAMRVTVLENFALQAADVRSMSPSCWLPEPPLFVFVSFQGLFKALTKTAPETIDQGFLKQAAHRNQMAIASARDTRPY